MAVTADKALADRMRVMSLHGLSQDAWTRYSGGRAWDYRIVAPGYKYNLTDLAAAIGIHQVTRAEGMRTGRAQIAQPVLPCVRGSGLLRGAAGRTEPHPLVASFPDQAPPRGAGDRSQSVHRFVEGRRSGLLGSLAPAAFASLLRAARVDGGALSRRVAHLGAADQPSHLLGDDARGARAGGLGRPRDRPSTRPMTAPDQGPTPRRINVRSRGQPGPRPLIPPTSAS